VTTKIEQDDWDAWTSHPITKRLFNSFEFHAAKAKEAWVDVSWNGGRADPVNLACLKGRAEVLEQLATLSKDKLESYDDPAED